MQINDKIIKRSAIISGHKTSISLEKPFWEELKALAATKDMTVAALLTEIDMSRKGINLSSACRLYVLAEKTDLLKGYMYLK